MIWPEYPGAPLAGGYFDSEDVPAPAPQVPEPIEVVRRVGNPGKFTDAIKESIIRNVSEGASLNASARAAGITAPTLNNWLNDPRPEYVEFKERIEEARAYAFVGAEKIVKIAKPLDWIMRGPGRHFMEPDATGKSAPAWIDPVQRVEGKNVNLNANADVSTAGAIDTSKLPLEDLEQLERILMRAQGQPVIEVPALTDGSNDLTVRSDILNDGLASETLEAEDKNAELDADG